MKSTVVMVSLAILGIAACGGNSGTSSGGGAGGNGGSGGGPVACGEHPLDCPTGETCSFAEGGIFACLPSGAAALGEACSPIVGQATCKDDLLCVKKTGASEAACAMLCDPMLMSPCGDLLCVPVEQDSGDQTHACL